MAEDEVPHGGQENGGNGDNHSKQPRWLTDRPEYGDIIMGSTTAEKSLGIILFHLGEAQGHNEDGTSTGKFAPSQDAPHDTLPWQVTRGHDDEKQWSRVIVGDDKEANGFYILQKLDGSRETKIVRLENGNPTEEALPDDEINDLADTAAFHLVQTEGHPVYRP